MARRFACAHRSGNILIPLSQPSQNINIYRQCFLVAASNLYWIDRTSRLATRFLVSGDPHCIVHCHPRPLDYAGYNSVILLTSISPPRPASPARIGPRTGEVYRRVSRPPKQGTCPTARLCVGCRWRDDLSRTHISASGLRAQPCTFR